MEVIATFTESLQTRHAKLLNCGPKAGISNVFKLFTTADRRHVELPTKVTVSAASPSHTKAQYIKVIPNRGSYESELSKDTYGGRCRDDQVSPIQSKEPDVSSISTVGM